MTDDHIPLKKVRYLRKQSNTTYLVHEVRILFFTTKQTSQPSHANDDNPPSANMLRPHFPVNSIVQNNVLTQTALRLIGRTETITTYSTQSGTRNKVSSLLENKPLNLQAERSKATQYAPMSYR